jgi:riboflavin kinase / FMN adenylyltransferase
MCSRSSKWGSSARTGRSEHGLEGLQRLWYRPRLTMNSSAATSKPRLLVIGNFDGVHLGHQAVLDRALRESIPQGLTPTVLTFDPHPAVVLGHEAPTALTLHADKVRLLRDLDPALEVVTWPFTRELAAYSPEQFADLVLARALSARVVVVGQNFRFGRGRAGDLSVLGALGDKLGFVARSEPLRGDSTGPYSSTRIRQALDDGDVGGAAALLGRAHFASGVVERGDGRGQALGFPTANLGQVGVAVPADGVYAGLADWGEGPKPCVMNIGARPTFTTVRALEVHVLDCRPDLYGVGLTVHFHTRLREVRRFGSIDELVRQIREDIQHARRLPLSGTPFPDAQP